MVYGGRWVGGEDRWGGGVWEGVGEAYVPHVNGYNMVVFGELLKLVAPREPKL